MKPPKITYLSVLFNTQMIVLSLLLLVGVIILCVGLKDWWDQNELDQFGGITVPAKVTQHESSTDSDNNTSYSITYFYKDEAEHHFNGSLSMNEADWNQVSVGDTISIMYSTKDHSISSPPGSRSLFWSGLTDVVIGFIWTTVVSIILLIIIEKGIKRVHIFNKGFSFIVQADVDVVKGTDSDGAETKEYCLTYSYFQSGQSISGRAPLSKSRYREWQSSIQQGRRDLEIYYDPDKPIDHIVVVGEDKIVDGVGKRRML